MNRLTRAASAIAVVVLMATAGFATLSGQPERAQPSEMKALVDEVRALRLSVERAAAHSSQAQVLLGRVQLQESRLTVLSRQYLEARSLSLRVQAEQKELEGQLRSLSESLDTGSPSQEERRAVEDRTKQLKNSLEAVHVRLGQLRTDENSAADALSTEQQRWADFNDRLETLERTIGSVAAPRP